MKQQAPRSSAWSTRAHQSAPGQVSVAFYGLLDTVAVENDLLAARAGKFDGILCLPQGDAVVEILRVDGQRRRQF